MACPICGANCKCKKRGPNGECCSCHKHKAGKHPAAEFTLDVPERKDKHARYSVVENSVGRLVIRDVGPWDRHFTVTNDAEFVVMELAESLNGRRLLYFDSENELGELVVKDGRFVAFAPAIEHVETVAR